MSPAMNPTRQMNWTCPKCLVRNARPIPPDTEHGRLLAVRCAGCGAEHLATAIVRPQPGGEPAVYGVAWI
jgi:hypothetical protein